MTNLVIDLFLKNRCITTMRIIGIVLLTLSIISKVSAQTFTAGPLSGNSFTTAPISGSSQSWTNTSNAGADDGIDATFGNLPDKSVSLTNYIVITNFNFAIPSNASILGILVEVDRSDSNQRTSDYRTQIVKGGSIESGNKSTGTPYPSTDSYKSYGGSGDLWGQSWSYSDINSSNFGIAIAAQRSGSGSTTAGGIDNVRITITYTLTILPLNLVDFTATSNKNSILVNWITSSETNMNHYEVQRSSDGINFNSLKNIPSTNSQSEQRYSYNDNNPLPGNSYYRLLMVGNSGYEKYSSIVSVVFNYNKTITLYPNPLHAGDNLYISNPGNEKLTVSFYDLNGKKISDLSTNTNQLSTGSLQQLKGEFIYRIYNSKTEVTGNGKIVLQ